MELKLGIDTGCSYTDIVLVNCNTGEVIKKAKVATTKEDLAVGIEAAIDQLDIGHTENIKLVYMSTTLATNAIIEGKGATVGLITINEPKECTYPANYKFNIDGKINMKGCEISPLDMEGVENAFRFMKGRIETLAISGYASIRNPSYERKIKRFSDEMLGVPVVCAHEVTSMLGYYERTTTATLNAKLIPVIKDLILKVKKALLSKNITATVLIIKGDGKCMTDTFAEERPIETLLSGPATSALGGMVLVDRQSMVVADMGGTTLDVIPIQGRKIPIDACGAIVGRWKTRVKSLRSSSFGLGGDTYMRLDNKGNISFGPERVVPLCVEAEKNEDLLDEIRCLNMKDDYHILERQENDCLKLLNVSNSKLEILDNEEKTIIEMLKERSHSISYLGEKLGKDIDAVRINRLLSLDIVQLISLTPTDILHATGEYLEYNRKISTIAINNLAKRKGTSVSEFLTYIEGAFTERLCKSIVKSLLTDKGIKEDHVLDEAVKCIFDRTNRDRKLANFDFSLNVPIVAIGSPAKAWFTKVSERLGCEVIIPENNEVANAIGAGIGDIEESLEALLRYDYHLKRYLAYLPNRRVIFEDKEKAIDFVEKELLAYAKEFTNKIGVNKFKPCILTKQFTTLNHVDPQDAFVELRMKVVISAET